MNRMLEDARLSALAMNAEITKVVFVPGTYEAPLILENMLMDDSLDAACVLGYIEKGSTLHGGGDRRAGGNESRVRWECDSCRG